MANTVLPLVKIIKVGTIAFESTEMASTYNLQLKSDLGIGGGSAVTLIQTDQNILVDTGFEFEWIDTAENKKNNANILTTALKNAGIKPDDIDIVFITHWHKDHFGNIGILKNAKYTANKSLVKSFGLDDFIGIGDGEEIAEGIKAFQTPGHTIDHMSILVNTKYKSTKVRIAITGDAIISHSYFQIGQIWKYNADFFDSNESRKSILHIVESSDVIIPGHSVPFMTYKPEWLK